MHALTFPTSRFRFGIVLSLFLTYLGLSQAIAQQPPANPPAVTAVPTIADPKAWVAKFLDTLQKKGVTPATDLFINESIYGIRSNKAEVQKQFIASLNNAQTLLGKIARTEMVEVKKFGDGLIRYRTLIHYQQGPVLMEFTFYKTDKKWTLIGYNINGSISVLPF